MTTAESTRFVVLVEDVRGARRSERGQREDGALDLAPEVAPPEVDEGPDDLAHYARNDELALARRQGRAVRALCGTLFLPHLDPHLLPVCVVCEGLARG